MESIKKIAIVGVESTGKTTLAAQLAQHYNTLWVPEVARAFLENLGREYTEADLLSIAKLQISTENTMIFSANGILFSDTNLSVIKIWSEYKYGRCNSEIIEMLNTTRYDGILLTAIDLPWQADDLRETPNVKEREYLHAQYLHYAQNAAIPYYEIAGIGNLRLRNAIQAVEAIIIPNS